MFLTILVQINFIFTKLLIMNPFKTDFFEVNVDLQETFSELQTDLEFKVKFS